MILGSVLPWVWAEESYSAIKYVSLFEEWSRELCIESLTLYYKKLTGNRSMNEIRTNYTQKMAFLWRRNVMFSLDRGMNLYLYHIFKEWTTSIGGIKQAVCFILPTSFWSPIHQWVHTTSAWLIEPHYVNVSLPIFD